MLVQNAVCGITVMFGKQDRILRSHRGRCQLCSQVRIIGWWLQNRDMTVCESRVVVTRGSTWEGSGFARDSVIECGRIVFPVLRSETKARD